VLASNRSTNEETLIERIGDRLGQIGGGGATQEEDGLHRRVGGVTQKEGLCRQVGGVTQEEGLYRQVGESTQEEGLHRRVGGVTQEGLHRQVGGPTQDGYCYAHNRQDDNTRAPAAPRTEKMSEYNQSERIIPSSSLGRSDDSESDSQNGT